MALSPLLMLLEHGPFPSLLSKSVPSDLLQVTGHTERILFEQRVDFLRVCFCGEQKLRGCFYMEMPESREVLAKGVSTPALSLSLHTGAGFGGSGPGSSSLPSPAGISLHQCF